MLDVVAFPDGGQLFAQGVNLLYFIFSSGAATAVNLRKRRIVYGAVLLMSLGGVFGAVIGAILASMIDPAYLRIGFGVMLLLGGIPALLSSVVALGSKKAPEDF